MSQALHVGADLILAFDDQRSLVGKDAACLGNGVEIHRQNGVVPARPRSLFFVAVCIVISERLMCSIPRFFSSPGVAIKPFHVRGVEHNGVEGSVVIREPATVGSRRNVRRGQVVCVLRDFLPEHAFAISNIGNRRTLRDVQSEYARKYVGIASDADGRDQIGRRLTLRRFARDGLPRLATLVEAIGDLQPYLRIIARGVFHCFAGRGCGHEYSLPLLLVYGFSCLLSGVFGVGTANRTITFNDSSGYRRGDKMESQTQVASAHGGSAPGRITNGKHGYALSRRGHHSQHASPGGSCTRARATKQRMTDDERMRLAQRRGQASFRWFDQQVVPGTGFHTLEKALWMPLLSAEGAANPEPALTKLALLALDEAGIVRATVAGVLLCTQNPEDWLPNAGITATRYRGKDRASGQVDAQEITGPLNRQIADAVAFAIRNMHVAARKEPARVDLPQYSDKALFEALVNAVAHRDYSMRGSKIRLSMFDDRLEIQSPGSLPNNLTVDSMDQRQATRNETVTSVLGRMSVREVRGSEDRRYFMERRGDGVPTILRETKKLCGKPPEYRVIDESEVCLTIPAAPQEQSAARVVITVRCAGNPLAGADVLALFPNNTWKRATTDKHGEAALDLHSTHLPMTVFAAAADHTAHAHYNWTPAQCGLALELDALPAGGGVIFPDATGTIPGINGRLNPIRDTYDRTYLYASNVAINKGRPQPVHFIPGEPLRLTDANGNEAQARIVAIVGRSALVEYRACSGGEGE